MPILCTCTIQSKYTYKNFSTEPRATFMIFHQNKTYLLSSCSCLFRPGVVAVKAIARPPPSPKVAILDDKRQANSFSYGERYFLTVSFSSSISSILSGLRTTASHLQNTAKHCGSYHNRKADRQNLVVQHTGVMSGQRSCQCYPVRTFRVWVWARDDFP